MIRVKHVPEGHTLGEGCIVSVWFMPGYNTLDKLSMPDVNQPVDTPVQVVLCGANALHCGEHL